MAYKFQLGAAVLSGSLTQEGQILAKDSKVSGSTIGITDASGLVESGGGLANASGKLELEMVNDGITALEFNLNGDTLYIGSQANGGNIRSGSIADMVSRMTGSALAASNGLLSVSNLANAQVASNAAIDFSKLAALSSGNFLVGNASNQAASVAMSGDATLGNNGAVTLAAAQTNITSIFNSGFEAIGTANNQEYIDFSNSNEIQLAINNSAMLSITSTGIEVAGNLTVEGTSSAIHSNTLLVKDKTIELNVVTGSEGRATNSGAGFFISGSTTDKEASLLLTADGGKFKASGSTGGGFDVAEGGGYAINGTTLLSATALHANVIVDGDSLDIAGCTSTLDNTTIADADLFIVDDNAASDPKKITAGNLKTFFQDGVTASSTNGFSLNTYNTASAAQSMGGNTGVWISNDPGGASSNAISLHLSGAWSNGNVVIVKAPSNGATNNLTIFASGSQLIDGASSIVIESDFGAVSLVYGDNDNWFIF